MMFMQSHLAVADDRTTPLSVLINEATSLDRMEVVVQGEAIGEILPRGEYAWVSIQEGASQMSIWVPINLANQIKHLGDYNTTGDIVEIEGEFQRADEQLQGEMRVKANTIKIITSGQRRDHPVEQIKLHITIILGFLLLGIFVLSRVMKRRKQRV